MATDFLKVAALQMVSGDNLAENLGRARALVSSAAESGAKLAVLPECFSLMAGTKALMQAAETEAGFAAIQTELASWAKQFDINIVAGTLGIADGGGKARAAVCLYADSGDRIARYDKMHLFDADVGDAKGRYRESDNYSAGDEIVVVELCGLNIGLAVCYDLRFPEMFRLMQEQSVDLIAVPAAFTRRTGLAHWLPLIRARAIENQCAVIGANQGGQHGAKRLTSGGSVIVDSWGAVLAEAGLGESLITAEIDFTAQRQLRQAMPVAGHRRIRTLF